MKTLNKILANLIQHTLKGECIIIKWDLFQGWKNGSTLTNQHDVPTSTKWRINIIWFFSTGVEKAYNKIQLPFMIKKKSQQSVYKGTYLNIIKVIYVKSTVNIILSGENWRFSSKIRNKTRMPNLVTFIQYGIKSPSHSN